jgi:hypothetical protein
MKKTLLWVRFCSTLAFACVFAHAQAWQTIPKSDPLTGKSETTYILTGTFLTAPQHGSGQPPMFTLKCDPSPNHSRFSGKLLNAFSVVNAVVDLKNGGNTTVRYRLDDGKPQDANLVEYSTDFQAIHLQQLLVNNLLWGHMLFHKPGKGDQVHKVIFAVQEHLGGQVVMQFDMPDAQEVGAACGTEYRP